MNVILRSEPIDIPDAKKCRENHGLVAAIPREDMTFKRSKFLTDKRVEYEDDEVLSKFLTSNKSDEYKYLIIKLLETDYSKCTYGSTYKRSQGVYNEELAMKLGEMEFKKMKRLELQILAKNLWIRGSHNISKKDLIEKIENVKELFSKK